MLKISHAPLHIRASAACAQTARLEVAVAANTSLNGSLVFYSVTYKSTEAAVGECSAKLEMQLSNRTEVAW